MATTVALTWILRRCGFSVDQSFLQQGRHSCDKYPGVTHPSAITRPFMRLKLASPTI
jgi:hypothetical protein